MYHQCVFAALMVATATREAQLLFWSEASRTIPDKKKATIVQVLRTGGCAFLFGFFIWNLDNILCRPWTPIKHAVGWPTAFFMEGKFCDNWNDMSYSTRCTGHAWWHVLTVSAPHFRPLRWNLSFCSGKGAWNFLSFPGHNVYAY